MKWKKYEELENAAARCRYGCEYQLRGPQVVDKVAAVVNNGVVLESDVDGLMKSVKLNSGEAGQQLPDDATLRHQILERLIMDQIVLQMGQKMGVKVTDEQLDQAITNIAKQNNMSLDQMRSRLAYDGISYATYRNQIRKEMLISEVRNNEVRRRVTILPQEVDALAKQVGNQNDASTELNLSHILIPLPENPTSDQAAEAESQARSIVEQARNGGDFGKLAITYSADQQALKGGQMGWGRIQELPSIFAQALSTAKKGDIVGPIRSGVGFHILKVNDLRGQSQNISVTEVHARHILLKPSPIMTDDQHVRSWSRLRQTLRAVKPRLPMPRRSSLRIQALLIRAAIWAGLQQIFTILPSAMR